MLAIGDPDFDATGPAAAVVQEPGEPASDPADASRGRRSRCAEHGAARWSRLPETRAEVERIAQLWERSAKHRPTAGRSAALPVGGWSESWTGAHADEARFKSSASGHRVIHLATHGFFLDSSCPGDTAFRGARPSSARGPVERNPLLLSGLVFAGANRRDEAPASADDGILTAEEITSLDLAGTEWAVLSACETGAGSVAEGEGVFGLRRAFQIAGVQTTIMSLWAVEDRSTRIFMEELYQARLDRGLGTSEAMRAASLEVLRQLRRHGESTHPLYWGAFVASEAIEVAPGSRPPAR
jgi:hypothetical protein